MSTGHDATALETSPRTYSRDELRHSEDDMLECAACGIVIDPGTQLVYLVGAKEGFHFYHQGQCANAALAEVAP